MNKPLRHVMAVLLACFTILFIQLNRIQVFGAEALIENSANTRTIQRNFDRDRGLISTIDGVVVAESLDTPGEVFSQQRSYPHGSLYAHSVGYLSFNFGAEGVERTYNAPLTGTTPTQELTDLTNILTGTDQVGNVVLSIDHRMQERARAELGERSGSVVALDPSTGAIRAFWSFPSFDPNRLAVNDGSVANEAWTELLEAEGNPLRAAMYRDRYFPGSTFKVITAASGLENGLITAEQPVFEESDGYVAPLTDRPLTNFAGATCGGNLTELLVESCNTGFGELAAEILGPERLTDTAQNFGFNVSPPFDLADPVVSEFPSDYGSLINNDVPAGVYENTPLLAQAGIGQFDVQASPLEMALVAAAVANGGQLPTPHVVERVENSVTLQTIDDVNPGSWQRAMSGDTAQTLAELMVQAVERGTGRAAIVPGVVVGGKTGTAQLGTDPPQSHAWFIAFAGRPGEAADLAIAVLVEANENAGNQTGGGVAAPIARAMIEQYYQSFGE